MKRLMRFLKPYRIPSILAPLFKLLEALMDLFVPLVVAAIIDNGITRRDMHYVAVCFWILILLAVLGIAFSFMAQWFAARAAVGFSTDVRQAVFDHIQEMSYSELDTLGTDTLINRMTSDINQTQNGVNMSLRLLLRSPFIVFGSMILAFLIDVPSAIVFAVIIPLLILVVFGIMLRSIPLYRRAQTALDRLLGLTRENLTGVRVIRAFCREKEEIREFDERNDALTRMNEFVGRLSALMNPVTYVMINLATVVLIRVGAIRVGSGALSQGDVVALYNYMAQITVELIKMASLIVTLNRSLACAGRVADVLDTKTGMTYPEAAGPAASGAKTGAPAVEFRSVSFSYAGSGEDAVSGISFRAEKGQTIGIIGGTGSGKSTVVNLIPRFYDATQGQVLVDGKDVRDYPEGSLIQKMGVVPQKAVLFEGRLRSNLLWGKENADDEQLMAAVRTAQASEVVEGKEDGLDSPVEQNGRNFSGGQRQRLTIARALVRKPEILIMDDSASALDFATDARLRQAVRDLPGSMTVFIVSQRASSIRGADQILVLDDGQMVGLGTHDELMRSCRVYQEIYYSQFPEERPKSAVTSGEVMA